MCRFPKISLLIITLIFGLWLLKIDNAHAQSVEKPRIAIKTPLVGEGIGKNSHKYLNISQLLAEMDLQRHAFLGDHEGIFLADAALTASQIDGHDGPRGFRGEGDHGGTAFAGVAG